MAPGIRIFATPGHTPGHQSLVVDTPDGPVVLAGQAVYTPGEWTGDPDAREGRSTRRTRRPTPARSPDSGALDPKRVLFGHDRTAWTGLTGA